MGPSGGKWELSKIVFKLKDYSTNLLFEICLLANTHTT